jgi:hypothetical protein
MWQCEAETMKSIAKDCKIVDLDHKCLSEYDLKLTQGRNLIKVV